jgi:hypothetical protein
MQRVADAHETSVSVVLVAPGMSFAPNMVQLLPFQRLASGLAPVAPFGVLPTAMHASADVHEMPFSELPWAGCGTLWTVQDDPLLLSDST